MECYWCRRIGHIARDCPVVECFRCNRRGHMAKECLKPFVCEECGGRGHLAAYCLREINVRRTDPEQLLDNHDPRGLPLQTDYMEMRDLMFQKDPHIVGVLSNMMRENLRDVAASRINIICSLVNTLMLPGRDLEDAKIGQAKDILNELRNDDLDRDWLHAGLAKAINRRRMVQVLKNNETQRRICQENMDRAKGELRHWENMAKNAARQMLAMHQQAAPPSIPELLRLQ